MIQSWYTIYLPNLISYLLENTRLFQASRLVCFLPPCCRSRHMAHKRVGANLGCSGRPMRSRRSLVYQSVPQVPHQCHIIVYGGTGAYFFFIVLTVRPGWSCIELVRCLGDLNKRLSPVGEKFAHLCFTTSFTDRRISQGIRVQVGDDHFGVKGPESEGVCHDIESVTPKI